MATEKKSKSNVVKMYRINTNDEITAINTYGEFEHYGEKRVWTKKDRHIDYPRRYSEPARNLFKTPKAAIKSLDRRYTRIIDRHDKIAADLTARRNDKIASAEAKFGVNYP
jgi:hypothetical protein